MASNESSACMIERGVPALVSLGQSEAGRHWVATAGDERDVFISWLRGEFAAANAMIDALCQHLQQVVGSPGEYDFVLGSIHQRRYNWNPVLHMQQYYSIAEVLFALQQVAFRKQVSASNGDEPAPAEELRPGSSLDKVPGSDAEKKAEETMVIENKDQLASKDSDKAESETATLSNGELRPEVSSSNGSLRKRSSADTKKMVPATEASPRIPSSGVEEIDGKQVCILPQVNVLEGLKIHEGLFDANEVSRLATLVIESHAAKKKAKSEGSKRSSKTKAKDVIHFGTIPSEISSTLTETAEPMPAFLESIIDCLVKFEVVPLSKRPDACSISVLEPGDYMPPHKHSNFEQPLFILSLGSQSELSFGRCLKASKTEEAAGKYRAFLPVGSVLVLEGNSAQMVQCAVPPLQTTRILVTFGKMAKRTLKNIVVKPTSPVGSSTSPVSPTVTSEAYGSRNFVHVVPSRSFQASRSQATSTPMVVPVRTTGQVLQTQPVMIASVGPFSPVTVVGPGWSTPPPGITRVPSPGTGVFLPASNGNSHRRQAAAHHFDSHSTNSSGHHQKAVAA